MGLLNRTPAMLSQHIPDDRRELASGRDDGNLLAAIIAHAREEGSQWSGRLRGAPGRLDPHRPCIRTPALGDVPVPGRC